MNPFEYVLQDVPRYSVNRYGEEYLIADGEYFMRDDVLAALAAAVTADLAEAGKVLEGVTPGPWAVDALQLGTQGDITTADGEICVAQAQMRIPMASGKKDAERAANARFIAWCREGVPALLARIAAQEAQIKGQSADIDRLKAIVVAQGQTMAERLTRADLAETALAAMTKERDGLLTTWAESRERHLTAETALAAERAKVAKLVDLLCLADEAIMQEHGCFPLDRTNERQIFLNDACTAIRNITGDDYTERKRRARAAITEAGQ